MRFLLYNIRYGAGTGTGFHLPFPYSGYLKPTNGNFDNISNFICAMQPDIVGLVEVDAGTFRTEKRNQAEDIAKILCHRHVYSPKYAKNSIAFRFPLLNKQGNALLTNRNILERRFHYLNNGVKRLVIEIELEEFHLFLVHLALKYGPRQHQLNELAEIVASRQKPVVVAGDFNVFRGVSELDAFCRRTRLMNADGYGRPSHPSKSPFRQLDHILHSPEIRTTGFVAPHVTYSDHIPLIWDFSLVPVSIQPDEPLAAAG